MNRAALVTISALLLVAGCTACSSGSSTTSAAAPAAAPSATATASAAAAAASGSTAAAAGSGSSDPCSLATVAQIQALFGGTVSAGAASTDATQVNPNCVWQVTASNFGGSGEVDIYLPAAMQDATKFGYAKDGSPGAIDVAGVGDAAFYSPKTAALTFASGDTVVTVQSVFIGGDGNTADAATTQSDLTALATEVAAAL